MDLSKIQKSRTLHTLKQSYAIHLQEREVYLRYTLYILGHKDPKTTQIYTHLTIDDLPRIVSPLEKINLNQDSH
jgi:integrase/recombinase XerD